LFEAPALMVAPPGLLFEQKVAFFHCLQLGWTFYFGLNKHSKDPYLNGKKPLVLLMKTFSSKLVKFKIKKIFTD